MKRILEYKTHEADVDYSNNWSDKVKIINPGRYQVVNYVWRRRNETNLVSSGTLVKYITMLLQILKAAIFLDFQWKFFV